MKKSFFIYPVLRIMVTVAAVVALAEQSNAKMGDNVSFCTRSCTTASCNSSGVKAECKARCSDEKIWKIVAAQEMSGPQANLYSSQIAKCLDLKSNDIVDQKPPEQQPKFEPKPVSGKIASPTEDLCAAAMAAAHAEYNESNRATHGKIHEQNFASLMETHQNKEQNS
jgi:hypothetical protein